MLKTCLHVVYLEEAGIFPPQQLISSVSVTSEAFRFLSDLPVCQQEESRRDQCFGGVFSASTVSETVGKGCKSQLLPKSDTKLWEDNWSFKTPFFQWEGDLGPFLVTD